jgi:hypothetical protein
MNRKLLPTILLVGVLLLLAGCTASPNPSVNTPAPDGSPAGFWLGLWHGVILPITFVVSLFKASVGIYEVHNNGTWYNAGFVIGAVFFAVARRGNNAGQQVQRPQPKKQEKKQDVDDDEDTPPPAAPVKPAAPSAKAPGTPAAPPKKRT